MGYTTDFSGEFKLNKRLTHEHEVYLRAFADSRRVKRDERKVEKLPDPIRKAVMLRAGKDGGLYVGKVGENSFNSDPEAKVGCIIDINIPPEGQPGLWCDWVPNEDGTAIVWNGGEKFYNYVEWLEYIITTFLKPWGYVLNGDVEWQGEESDDRGMIRVHNNRIKTLKGRTVYE